MADNQDPVFQIQRVYLKDLSLEQPNSPRILMELNNTEACKRVVLAGLGAALLPQMAIHEELRRGDIVVLRVEGHPAP